MTVLDVFRQYVEHLFAGKRCEARQVIFAAQDRGVTASSLLASVVWPAMEQVTRLYRQHRISRVVEHMATRINRMIADQLNGFLAREPRTGKRIVVGCGDGEMEELGAQMLADLFEAKGWTVWFVGSGVPDDEVLQLIGRLSPDVLCFHGTQPSAVPKMRGLIELIRRVGVCPDMQVLVTGGVFSRAEGLADEIHADLFAPDAASALRTVEEHPIRIPKPDVPEPGRRRKRRRRRLSARRRVAVPC